MTGRTMMPMERTHWTRGVTNPPWECTRCGAINAWWVPRCKCKPAKRGIS